MDKAEFIKKQRETLVAAYNRLSLEHDIPLRIAEAICVSGVFALTVGAEATIKHMPNKRASAITQWVRTWDCYAEVHSISDTKMCAIIEQASDLLLPIVNVAVNEADAAQAKHG